MSIFDKFKNGINQEDINNAIKEANENSGGGFKEVPAGNYEVSVEKIELGKTKKGADKISMWFKILAGEYKGCLLFKTSVLTEEWQLGKAIQFLNDLKSDVEIVEIQNEDDFADLLTDIYDSIQDKGLEYEVEYIINKGGFGDVREIVQVFMD